eukprot:1073462-Alexandrium_andersonii.AAC.1
MRTTPASGSPASGGGRARVQTRSAPTTRSHSLTSALRLRAAAACRGLAIRDAVEAQGRAAGRRRSSH